MSVYCGHNCETNFEWNQTYLLFLLIIFLFFFHFWLFVILCVWCVLVIIIAIVLGPGIIWIVFSCFEVNIYCKLLATCRLHWHFVRQFYWFEATIGAVPRTEVPCHNLKIRPIQLLCNASAIFDWHDLVVRVDVRYVVAFFVDVRCEVIVHRIRGIAELKSEAAEPVFAVISSQWKRVLRLFELARNALFELKWLTFWIIRYGDPAEPLKN